MKGAYGPLATVSLSLVKSSSLICQHSTRSCTCFVAGSGSTLGHDIPVRLCPFSSWLSV